MDQNNKDNLLIEGHSYDGITELDNPMPTWWLWTFFITIIFSFIYFIHYEFAGAPTLKQELALAMEELNKNKGHVMGLMESEASIEEKTSDPKIFELGATVYAGKCAMCHGNELQGQIGPNLTDHFWIHGKGTKADVFKVIAEGVPEKGMPAWRGLLPQEELYAVVGFVSSKIGTNPANPKAPQGDAVK